jgi:hypothetical protein
VTPPLTTQHEGVVLELDKARTTREAAVAEFFKELTALLKLCAPLVRVAVNEQLKRSR